MRNYTFYIAIALIFGLKSAALSQASNYPHPVKNPKAPLMLAGDWMPEDSHDLDFFALPRVPSEHAIVNDVRYAWGRKVNQHNYLAYFNGMFWAMWSDGPGEPREGLTAEQHYHVTPGHDKSGQLISYSTSKDGINWTEKRDLAGNPDIGFAWIARGFWIRDGKLLGLATRYRAPGYRGEGLQLHAFEMTFDEEVKWKHLGVVLDNAMNNFPPKKISTGEWMMSRRDSIGDVYMIVGGSKAFNNWESYPVQGSRGQELAGEEPYWYQLKDGNLAALFRDNNKSGYLFRAFSSDNGRTWSTPVKTNFPDARSKFCALQLTDGRYVIVSNANPKKRDPLTIAISDDGLVFKKMGYLVGERIIDYPHLIQVGDYIYVTFDGAKQTVEVLKIRISDLDNLKMPSKDKMTLKVENN